MKGVQRLPSGDHLGNLGPLIPHCQMSIVDYLVFVFRPSSFFNGWIEMVVPSETHYKFRNVAFGAY